MRRRMFCLLTAVLLLALLLTGCSGQYDLIHFAVVDITNEEECHLERTCLLMTGETTKTLYLDNPDTQEFRMEFQVDSGELTVLLKDGQDGEYYSETLTENTSAVVGVSAGGDYTLIIQGRNYSGNYDIQWNAVSANGAAFDAPWEGRDFMKWNLSTDRPIYAQLIEQITYAIVSGEYQAGEKIPSVRDLAEEASVNPNTMQKALSELERNGLVYSQRTAGRYITEDETMLEKIKQQIAMEQIDRFLAQMERIGLTREQVLELIQKEAAGQ